MVAEDLPLATLPVDLLEGAVVEVIDPRLAAIAVRPNAGEEGDEGIPRHLHNAVELFIRTGLVENAQRLQRCTALYFALAEGRCEAAEGQRRFGEALVCWSCGHCGLARGAGAASEVADPRACGHCGSSEQTNFVQVLADGVALAWQELGPARPAAAARVEDLDAAPRDDPEAKRAAIRAAVEAARAKQVAAAPQEAELREPEPRLASIKVVPNDGEDAHPNFPKNLHNAAELFRRVGRLDCARALQRCTGDFLAVLDEGPQAAGRRGRGFVCFDCGFCGIAAEAAEKPASGKACGCTGCGSDEHTNFVQLVLPNGQELPWMERAPAAAAARPRARPNDPCPCGSGKKAKKCCHAGGL